MVEEGAVTGAPAKLAGFPKPLGFSALLDGAARLRPDRIALADSAEALTFESFDARVAALATQLVALDGGASRALLLGGASVGAVVLLFAALRAGLDVALAPAHLDVDEAEAFARDVDASIMLADDSFVETLGEELVLTLAASQPGMRVVCALRPMDGVVCLDAQASGDAPSGPADGRVILRDRDGAVRPCEQADLLAAALDVATQAKIGTDQPVLCTMSPMSFAGLVTGPLAALLAGAQCRLHGPFGSRRLADEIARLTPCHLVTPARVAPLLRDARTIAPGACASIILVHADDAPARQFSGVWAPVLDFTPHAGVAYSLTQRAAEPHPLTRLGERMRAAATSRSPDSQETHARD